MKKSIVSPYPIKEETFQVEVIALQKKYGFDEIYVAYADVVDGEHLSWNSFFEDCISEGMVEYLEIVIDDMKELLQN